MRKTIISCLAALGLAGCSPSPAGAPWQQAAVTAYLRKTLATPTSYQPVRWSPLTAWRLNALAKADLPAARQRLLATAAEARHDSADFALVARTAAQFGTSASDVALVKQRYVAGAQARDSCRAQLRRLLATQHDTTFAFYRLTHTYRFQNEQGRLELDSAQFNIGKQGTVVPLELFRISPPATSQPVPPPLPKAQ